MENTTYDPKTGKVAQYNQSAGKWEVLGKLSELSNEQKYSKIIDGPDGKQKGGFNRFTKKWEKVLEDDWVDKLPLPNSIERGVRKATLIDNNLLNTVGLESDKDFAAEVARVEGKIVQEPMSDKQAKGVKEIYESKSFPEFAGNIVKNPSAVGALVGESLGAMSGAGAIAMGLTGAGRLAKAAPWVLNTLSATGIGLGSASVEYANSFVDGLRDHGIDTLNQGDVVKALENKDLVGKLRAEASLRSVPIGVFDALSMGIAGRTFSTIARSGAQVAQEGAELTAGRVLAGSAGETAVQGALGAAGEASAQLASEGEIASPVDVGLEAALEGVTALPQAAVQTILTTPLADIQMPSIRNLAKAKGPEFKLEEEVIGQAKQEQKRAKKPLSGQVVDTDKVGSLSGFRSLVEDIQPEEMRILGEDAANITGDLETDAVNKFNRSNMFRSLVEGMQPEDLQVKNQRAYHGSPNKFTEFDTNRNGETTGANAYGWGLYFSNSKQVADWYRKEATKQPSKEQGRHPDSPKADMGQLYEVELPDNDNLLDNEAPLTKQPKAIRDAIEEDPVMFEIGAVTEDGLLNPKLSGRDLYFRLSQKLSPPEPSKEGMDGWTKVDRGDRGDKAASKRLAERGIKGIKYKNRSSGIEADNFVIFDPKAVEIAAVEYQRAMDQKFNELNTSNVLGANSSWDLAVENLRGLSLRRTTPETKNLIKEIQKAIRSSFGEKPAIAFYDTLSSIENTENFDPIRGAQWLNNIAIALNLQDGTTNIDPFDTGMHEGWHWAKRAPGFFTTSDTAVLEADRHRLLNYVQEQTGLQQSDIEQIGVTKEGQEELEAWAFGLYASNKLRNTKYKAEGLLPRLTQLFDKLINYFKTLGRALSGRRFEDIFDDVYEGRNLNNIVNEGLLNNQTIRWQKISQGAQAKHQQDLDNLAKRAPDEMVEALKYDNSELGPIGAWGRYVNSITHLASKSKVMGQVYSLFRLREAVINNISGAIDAPLKASGYHSLTREKRDALGNLADYLRKTKQKGTLDANGQLTFNRDGKIVRLKDKELSKQYMALQESYKVALSQLFGNLKAYWSKHFDLPVNFTKEDVKNKIADAKTDSAKNTYKNILDNLNTFDKLGKQDYVPRIRYGDFGIVVKDSSDKTVAFYTIERGKERGKYNKLQLQEIQDNLQSKYSDTKKFKIYGKNGQITNVSNIDKITPFGLTHNEISKNLDNSAVSLELLAGMIQSKNLDVKAFEQLQQDLYSKITKSGFAKHMLESEDIDGYSTDWSRSQYAYEQGLSNYIGNLSIRDGLNGLRAILNGARAWEDPDLKAAVQKYVDYMGSPQEEYMRMRAFNFLWVMGGNLSSAILQVFTLPTLTLGNITKFNTNIASNLSCMNKYWWSVTRYFGGGLSFHDSSVFVPFDDEATLQKMVDNKVFLDAKQAKFNKWLADRNYLGALLTEEYAGRKQYETRDTQGRIRENLSSVANLLGVPISIAEQATRFVSVNAAYEQLSKIPDIETKIMDVLGNDQRFLAQLERNKDIGLIENAALFTMDESHSVMGRVARAPFQRGLGGALVFPFMGYPQNAIESMARMWGQGKEGKVALATTLGAFMLLSGMIGLPGAELLKELYEAAVKATTGEEMDLDMEIRSKIYNATGSDTLGKLATQGAIRAYGEVDFAKRIGASIPGQDLLLALTGIRGEASDVLGVHGGLLTQMAEFWNNYNTDASLGTTVASLSPTALANILKAQEYADEGVYTSKRTKLVDSKDLGLNSVILRGMGFTSGEVADYRERNFYAKVLENRFTPFLNTQREKAKNHLSRSFKYQNEGNLDKASKEMAEYEEVLARVLKKSMDEQYPIDLGAFQRSVLQGAIQREYPEDMFSKNLKKVARPHTQHLNDITGIE